MTAGTFGKALAHAEIAAVRAVEVLGLVAREVGPFVEDRRGGGDKIFFQSGRVDQERLDERAGKPLDLSHRRIIRLEAVRFAVENAVRFIRFA